MEYLHKAKGCHIGDIGNSALMDGGVKGWKSLKEGRL
jgi:hypothetical protein